MSPVIPVLCGTTLWPDLTSPDLTALPQATYDGETPDNQAGSSLEASLDKMEYIFYSNMKQTKLSLKCELNDCCNVFEGITFR